MERGLLVIDDDAQITVGVGHGELGGVLLIIGGNLQQVHRVIALGHLLKVPADYEKNSSEFTMLNTYSDLSIVVNHK